MRSHFGFIGFGLIGGSIARALRALYPDCEISAYNYYETKPHEKLELAKKEGTLTAINTSLSDFSGCDVLFLCAPVMTNIAYLERLAPHLNTNCILTDVGSTKSSIHQAVDRLGLNRQFIGGHPMTGSEKTGYLHSDAAILKDAYYLLTPTEETLAEYTEWMKQFVHDIGSVCLILDAASHDRITAGISHAPHVISAALVNTVSANDYDGTYARLAAGGFRDITRISSSSPEIWQNICLSNREGVADFLEEYIDCLRTIKKEITDGNAAALTQFFSTAKTYRDRITHTTKARKEN